MSRNIIAIVCIAAVFLAVLAIAQIRRAANVSGNPDVSAGESEPNDGPNVEPVLVNQTEFEEDQTGVLDSPEPSELAAKGGKKRPPMAPPLPPPPPPPPISMYPLHSNITATVFWVGEPVGGGSSEDNALSAWDDAWQEHFGGYDDPVNRNGYYPVGFTPKENPFYLDLPHNDFDENGSRKASAYVLIPWAKEKVWPNNESMMKNRWVRLVRNGVVCFGQIEDAGPYEYDDVAYVFGTSSPKNTFANNAGLDVSPALRDCLKFVGLNNDGNRVDWQFVNTVDVPDGPWKQIVTTSLIYWP